MSRLFDQPAAAKACLVVRSERGICWPHTPAGGGALLTRIVLAGQLTPLRLDPPGLDVDAGQ